MLGEVRRAGLDVVTTFMYAHLAAHTAPAVSGTRLLITEEKD